jgi:hypothetical protein
MLSRATISASLAVCAARYGRLVKAWQDERERANDARCEPYGLF